VQALLSKRAALITGKGGVGRSSVTAALALLAQRHGKRVLVTEISDGSEGHSPLAQLFGRPHLPTDARPIAPGIHGSQLRSDAGVELFLTSVIRVKALAKSAMGFDPLRRLFYAVPSLRELGVFFHLLTYLRATDPATRAHKYELILVDMPATGHTLALTGLPQVILRLMSRGPIAEAIREGQSYLNAADKAGAYVVTLPEELPVSEALELLDGLEKTSMPRGGVFVNRVPADRFNREETDAVLRYLDGRSVYGAAGFHRIQEARQALERLRKSTEVPLHTIPELEKASTELVSEIADVLHGGAGASKKGATG
jgi:anion-transporting  ArsA/GET3 family ATPase